MLAERYGRKISDRMIAFLEQVYGQLNRIDFKQFVKIVRDFIRGGPQVHSKFCFYAMNLTGNGKICEHDLFQILEQYKQ